MLQEDLRAALPLAVDHGNLREVQALLERGAVLDRSLADVYLVAGADRGRLDLCRLLLDEGASPNAVASLNGDGAPGSALLHAAQNGHTEVVGLLLDRGADIDAASQNGETALMAAGVLGHRDTVKALLERGANPAVQDNGGATAYGRARHFARSEDAETVDALRAAEESQMLDLALPSASAAPAPRKRLGPDPDETRRLRPTEGPATRHTYGSVPRSGIDLD